MKLPYKIEIRNFCDIIKECFGIEDPKREKRNIVQLEEIVIHKQPKIVKIEDIKKVEINNIRECPKIKIYHDRNDIHLNKYFMVDSSDNIDHLEDNVTSSLLSDNPEYVYL